MYAKRRVTLVCGVCCPFLHCQCVRMHMVRMHDVCRVWCACTHDALALGSFNATVGLTEAMNNQCTGTHQDNYQLTLSRSNDTVHLVLSSAI
jgi:hypothetical protein